MPGVFGLIAQRAELVEGKALLGRLVAIPQVEYVCGTRHSSPRRVLPLGAKIDQRMKTMRAMWATARIRPRAFAPLYICPTPGSTAERLAASQGPWGDRDPTRIFGVAFMG
jgi:hypothetical protein